MPLDTLRITSHDAIGSPSLGGATRSKMPSATTPMGWNSRRLRLAAPQADGRGHDVGGSHQCGVPRWVVEQTLGF